MQKNDKEKKEELTQDISPDDLDIRDEQEMTKEQKDNSPNGRNSTNLKK